MAAATAAAATRDVVLLARSLPSECTEEKERKNERRRDVIAARRDSVQFSLPPSSSVVLSVSRGERMGVAQGRSFRESASTVYVCVCGLYVNVEV